MGSDACAQIARQITMARKAKRTFLGKETLFLLVTIAGIAALAAVGIRAMGAWT